MATVIAPNFRTPRRVQDLFGAIKELYFLTPAHNTLTLISCIICRSLPMFECSTVHFFLSNPEVL